MLRIVEAKKEDIYDDIREGYLDSAKERLTRFNGALIFAWQIEVITYKEWNTYQDWAHQTYEEILKLQRELEREGYKTSL